MVPAHRAAESQQTPQPEDPRHHHHHHRHHLHALALHAAALPQLVQALPLHHARMLPQAPLQQGVRALLLQQAVGLLAAAGCLCLRPAHLHHLLLLLLR